MTSPKPRSAGGLVLVTPKPPASWKGGVRCISDLHVGAPQVDYRLIDRELADARDRGDRVCVNGDVFDAILAKDHKRFEPDCLHRRLQGRKDILNSALDWAEEIFAPHARLIDFIGAGNHESCLERFHSVDPIGLLLERLNRNGGNVAHGGYTGVCRYPGLVLAYWHGSGGGSTLSSAAGEFDRKSFLEEADVMWFAHRHVRLVSQVERLCVRRGRPSSRKQWLIRTGAYFDTYRAQRPSEIASGGRKSNYAADAFLAPHGKGGLRVIRAVGGGVERVEMT